ncbi:MAG: MerR family transcriptional regulator [Desulfarculus sp.]|nr:MerR family transcriptional regulator [Desulfarculus sp.]
MPPRDPKPGLRMKELAAQSGLPKSTLLYYVEQGLLPAPIKTSPNMAYYPPSCLERLARIKTLQTRHRLPLGKIKALLDLQDQGHDISPLIELSQAIFGAEAGPLLERPAFLESTGLTAAQLDGLLAVGMLLPLQEDQFDQQDVAMGSLYANGLARGLTVQDMSFYPRLGRQIVDQEMALRHRLTSHLPISQNAALTLQMVQAARATRGYVIDRLFQKRVAASRDLQDPGQES